MKKKLCSHFTLTVRVLMLEFYPIRLRNRLPHGSFYALFLFPLIHKHWFLCIIKYKFGCSILHSEHSLRSGSAVARGLPVLDKGLTMFYNI